MANINLTYWGLTGVKGTVTVDEAILVDGLITAIATDEGLDTNYYVVSKLDDPSKSSYYYSDSSTTINTIGITNGSVLLCTPNQTGSKEQRQIQKLDIAQRKRQGGPADDSSVDVPYYRILNEYDRDSLPTKYVGNTTVDNANPAGLIPGRPWTGIYTTPPAAPFTNPTLTVGSAVTTVAQSPFAGGGNSYSFISSTNSYIQAPASADWAMGTGDFTVEWFGYQTTLAQFQRVFTVGDYPSIDFGVSIESGTFYFWSGGDADTDYSSASATTTNTWYHWAVVRSGTTLSVYRDGTLRGTTVSNTDNINDSLTPFVVGNTNTYATNAAFVGYITNFRLVKGLAVYTGNFTKPTSALTATASANPYGGSNTAAISAGFTKLLLVP
jgi:hypothetical protein